MRIFCSKLITCVYVFNEELPAGHVYIPSVTRMRALSRPSRLVIFRKVTFERPQKSSSFYVGESTTQDLSYKPENTRIRYMQMEN